MQVFFFDLQPWQITVFLSLELQWWKVAHLKAPRHIYFHLLKKQHSITFNICQDVLKSGNLRKSQSLLILNHCINLNFFKFTMLFLKNMRTFLVVSLCGDLYFANFQSIFFQHILHVFETDSTDSTAIDEWFLKSIVKLSLLLRDKMQTICQTHSVRMKQKN